MNKSKRTRWRILVAGALFLTVLTFTPLVTPMGSSEPALMEIPVTFWAGLLVSVGFVLLTFAATHCYPYQSADEKEDL